MPLEDRVITTGILMDFAAATSGMFAVPAGLLARLPEDGMHVVVPRGPAPIEGRILLCEAELDTGGVDPTRIPVFVPWDVWCQLPTAFAVVSAAAHLLPRVAEAAVVPSLEGYTADDDAPVNNAPFDEGWWE